MYHKDYFTIKNKKLSMRCTFANRKLSTVTAQDELMVNTNIHSVGLLKYNCFLRVFFFQSELIQLVCCISRDYCLNTDTYSVD